MSTEIQEATRNFSSIEESGSVVSKIVTKDHLDEWDDIITKGMSQILDTMSDIEGLASELGVGGMKEGIRMAFEQIEGAAQDLSGQLSIMEDHLEEDGTEILRIREGEFTVVSAEEADN
ncbi:MAG: hypothetical protein HOH43_10990 [Candidatus Latescibacteria bacterium]|jgi:hypothetical protein|nr:hypothetical protein [Candidatus Latescibacterota bacterium]